MPFVFNDIDLEERRFQQADVVAITHLPGKTLQNWNQRGVIAAKQQSPGKAAHRRYNGFEVFALDVMGQVTKLTRLPPAEALEVAKVAVAMIRDGFDGEGRSLNDERTLFLAWRNDKLEAWTDEPILEELAEATKRATPHIVLPITHLFFDLMNRMAIRVFGTTWFRTTSLHWLKTLPVQQLHSLLNQNDTMLEATHLSREDVEMELRNRKRQIEQNDM